MICSICGTDNPVGQRFCDNCGAPLASACPNCSASNRPDARFCGSCGHRLAAAEVAVGGTQQPFSSARGATPSAERRLVSVLFADLVGFTPFAEERDPEHVRETLTHYFDVARTVIERHGGMVEKFIGDAVMAVWGTPTAHEDDAERAVRAALELTSAIKSVDAGLDARAGVLTGEAAVTLGATGQGMVAGDLVNTAARLQGAAAPGTVLVGESTMRAAGAAITFEPAGQPELKGKTTPVPAWRALRIVAERGGRSRADTVEPPFVGRDSELALLKDLFHATGRERRARLVAVVGPAGIGKSRLAWELEKYVDGLVEGVYWHRGRSPSYGAEGAFWALGEMVRQRCGLAEDDDDATTGQRVIQTVAEYVTEEEDRRWVEPALLALLGVEAAPPGGRDVLFAAWRIFFENIAQRGTTVLLFEDLQFADSALLEFIDHLLEWSKGWPLLVLALARPELLERRPNFGSAARQFTSLPLEPLAEQYMAELLAGAVPGIDEQTVARIVARADGVPLYAVEIIRMLIADGHLEQRDDGTCRMRGELGELAVPDTLRSLVASRLDALDPGDRGLLQQASVLGQSFALDVLAATSATDRDELEARLRFLIRRELLTLEVDPRSPEMGQYRFVQGLIREVAYGTLARRQRRERHLAAARHYEATGDDQTAGALASHYLAAHQASEAGPEADAVATQARLALRAAAERAASLGAYGQAMAHLEQALAIAPDPADRGDLYERAARTAESAALYERGVELAQAGIAAYREVADAHGAARASGLLGTLYVDLARHGEATDVLEATLAELPDDELEMRAQLAARLSRALMRSKRSVESIRFADEALAIAEPRAMGETIAEALINKGSALSNIGRWREASVLGELGVKLAEQAGDHELQLRGLNNLGAVISDDDPARALRIGEEALAVARRLGLRGMVNWLTGSVAGGRYWNGIDWDEALSMLEETANDAGNDMDRARLTAAALGIRYARGDFDDATLERVKHAMRTIDDPSMTAFLEILRGERLVGKGDLAAAYDHFRRAAQIDAAGEWLGMTGPLRTAIWLGDGVKVAEAGVLLVAMPLSGRSVSCIRTWANAALAAVEDRPAEAVRGFLEAVGAARELGMNFEAARMVIDAATLFPREPGVLELVPFARATFERLGARVYLERLELVLAGPSREPESRRAKATR